MSGERCFLEAWFSKGVYRFRNFEIGDIPHPHVTFVRPFIIPENCEQIIKEKIIDYCKGKKPFPFILKGKGDFGGEISYIPVSGKEIEKFDTEIEALLEKDVLFTKKLADRKILHLTVASAQRSFPKTELYVLRLTGIKDKKIWFSFDFVTQESLNREESIDEKRWANTLNIFLLQKD